MDIDGVLDDYLTNGPSEAEPLLQKPDLPSMIRIKCNQPIDCCHWSLISEVHQLKTTRFPIVITRDNAVSIRPVLFVRTLEFLTLCLQFVIVDLFTNIVAHRSV